MVTNSNKDLVEIIGFENFDSVGISEFLKVFLLTDDHHTYHFLSTFLIEARSTVLKS